MKNISLKLTSAAVLCMAIAATATHANPNGEFINDDNVAASKGKLIAIFDKFDADKNGQLNKAEVSKLNNKAISANFDKIDSNKDQELSPKELKVFGKSFKL